MASPLDNLTDAIGLPKGFLDALYPFSLYQTNPPMMDRTGQQGQGGPPSLAPQPLGSPNPLAQQLPPPPGMGPLLANMQQGANPGGPGGLGMPPQMPGMGPPPSGMMGMPPMNFTPPSQNPAPGLSGGNPLWPWINRMTNPALPIPMPMRRLGMPGFPAPPAGLNGPNPLQAPMQLPPMFHRPRGGGNLRT